MDKQYPWVRKNRLLMKKEYDICKIKSLIRLTTSRLGKFKILTDNFEKENRKTGKKSLTGK